MADDEQHREAYENVVYEMETIEKSRQDNKRKPTVSSELPKENRASDGRLYIIMIGVLAILCASLCAVVVAMFYKSDQLSFQLYKEAGELNDKVRGLTAEHEKLKLPMETFTKEIEKLKVNVNDLKTGTDQQFRSELTDAINEIKTLTQASSEQAKQLSGLATTQKNTDSALKEIQKNRTNDLKSFEEKNAAMTNVLEATAKRVSQTENNTKDLQKLGSFMSPASSCSEIKMGDSSAPDGLYYLKDLQGNVFRTFCDMKTAGGGWTLIASVHENNMKGRCSNGDRWSSEQGFGDTHPNGDGFWENLATHGTASSAASDDYKNSGYFAMNASNIMIWQVPNDTPMQNFSTAAFLKYHTNNNFLRTYGGNLRSLYANHFPMRAKTYQMNTDNGPAIPIIWDVGSNNELLGYYGTKVKEEIDPGYIQFRAINHEKGAFAMCPGVRFKPGKGNVEHECLGSTSDTTNTAALCGDYAARDWVPEAAWQLDIKMITSVVMIFYK